MLPQRLYRCHGGACLPPANLLYPGLPCTGLCHACRMSLGPTHCHGPTRKGTCVRIQRTISSTYMEPHASCGMKIATQGPASTLLHGHDPMYLPGGIACLTTPAPPLSAQTVSLCTVGTRLPSEPSAPFPPFLPVHSTGGVCTAASDTGEYHINHPQHCPPHPGPAHHLAGHMRYNNTLVHVVHAYWGAHAHEGTTYTRQSTTQGYRSPWLMTHGCSGHLSGRAWEQRPTNWATAAPGHVTPLATYTDNTGTHNNTRHACHYAACGTLLACSLEATCMRPADAVCLCGQSPLFHHLGTLAPTFRR
jgi:hypothetical protein